jgi:CubicO group peptidase (beta-lactamase class C family)
MNKRSVVFGLVILTTVLCLSCEKRIQKAYWPTSEWQTVTPIQGKMDASVLNEIDPYVKANLPEVSSVLVLRNGYIVFERYFTGGIDTVRTLWNQTTSVLSAILGIAIDRGHIKNVDQKMIDFFPEKSAKSQDPRLSKITLRHLLTMTDGISASGNMLEFYFSDESKCQPLENDPGSEFTYNVVSPEILSLIITKATSRMAADLGREFLFGPLGIKEITWPESAPVHEWGKTSKRGYSRGLWGLALSTRDMAKIGYLYLNEGVWDDRRILQAEWVKESTKAQIVTGLSVDYWHGYGFHWWNCKFGSYPGFYSYGKSGQSICIVPDLRLVVVVTSTDPQAFKPAGEFIDESLLKYLEFSEKYLIGAAQKL